MTERHEYTTASSSSDKLPEVERLFFSTFSHMEIWKPDTGGRVIIQLGGEPGSQGRQYMSSVYTSRNENHVGNQHMLVGSQD